MFSPRYQLSKVHIVNILSSIFDKCSTHNKELNRKHIKLKINILIHKLRTIQGEGPTLLLNIEAVWRTLLFAIFIAKRLERDVTFKQTKKNVYIYMDEGYEYKYRK